MKRWWRQRLVVSWLEDLHSLLDWLICLATQSIFSSINVFWFHYHPACTGNRPQTHHPPPRRYRGPICYNPSGVVQGKRGPPWAPVCVAAARALFVSASPAGACPFARARRGGWVPRSRFGGGRCGQACRAPSASAPSCATWPDGSGTKPDEEIKIQIIE